jgi:hypothetical protein
MWYLLPWFDGMPASPSPDQNIQVGIEESSSHFVHVSPEDLDVLEDVIPRHG